jgi:hypothetical protein
VGEQHLDALAVVARLIERHGLTERTTAGQAYTSSTTGDSVGEAAVLQTGAHDAI